MASAAPVVAADGRRVTAGGGLYLALLLTAPVVYEFLVTVTGDARLMGWQPATLALLLTAAAAIAAWVPYRPAVEWRWDMKAWLVLLVLLWFYIAVVTAVVDDNGHLAAVIVPITAILLYLKRPTREAVFTAADVMVIGLVVAGAVCLILEALGVIPSWYDVLGGTFLELDDYDRANHWYLLGGLLGLDGRWGGPLRDPNLIGPAAALLVVYGFRRPGWRGVTIVVGGVLFAILADSRATYGAILIGLGALVVLPGWGPRRITWPRVLAAAVAVAAGVRLAIDVLADPAGSLTMTGRTGMWPDFLSLLERSPWTGVGSDAIAEAVESGVLPPWSYHGHNQFIDTVVRYGWIGVTLSALVVLAVVVRSVMAAWDRQGLALAMVIAFVVVSLANLLLDWRYPGVLLALLLVIALVAASTPRRERNR